MATVRGTYLLTLLRIIIGVVLIVAGSQKIGDFQVFAKDISNYRLLPESLTGLVASTVPWFELLVGGLLVVGWQTQTAAFSAVFLFLGFEIFVLSALARGLDVECGCFTGASRVSWLHAGSDLILLGIAVLLFFRGPGRLAVDRRRSVSEHPWTEGSRNAFATGALFFVINSLSLYGFGVPNARIPASFATPGTATADSKVIFDAPVLDLGEIPQERKARVVAVYRNIGTREARILEVKSSCGCTVPTPEKMVLLPGESAELEITYEPGANRGDVHQSVLLEIEGQEKPAFLSLEGKIVPSVVAEPALVELEPNQPVTVTLKSRDPQRLLAVTGITSPLDLVQFRSRQGGANEVMVELRAQGPVPQPPAGTDAWPLQVELGDGPPCVIYVRGKASK